MFDLLSGLFNGILSVFQILFTSVQSLVSLIVMIPNYISIATSLIAYLPTPIISVATLTISVYVLYLVIGR